MRRSLTNFSRNFGFSFHSRAHLIAISMIIVSMLQGVLLHSGAGWLLFNPYRTLFGFEFWRPFTSLLVATSAVEIIFGALIIYSLGGALEARWGSKRFLALVLGIPVIAQGGVLALTMVSPNTFYILYPGARQVITTLWILFGLSAHFSHEQLNFWGTPITGKTFALIGLGFVVLNAIFSGLLPVLPELFTAAICYLYMYRYRTGKWGERLTLGYYNWKLKRLKSRKNFKVIKGSGKFSYDDDNEEDNDNSSGGSGPQIH